MLDIIRLLIKNDLKSHRFAAVSLHIREQCPQMKKVRKGVKSQEYVQLGLDGGLCLVLIQHTLRGFLLLQLLVGSSFCFCNTVLQEHSFKGNSMILAETQSSSKHSAIYIIDCTKPFTAFHRHRPAIRAFYAQVVLFPGDFSDWRPGSRTLTTVLPV